MLSDSYRTQYKLQVVLAKRHDVQAKVTGFGLLLGVVLQVFVVFKASKMLKTDS